MLLGLALSFLQFYIFLYFAVGIGELLRKKKRTLRYKKFHVKKKNNIVFVALLGKKKNPSSPKYSVVTNKVLPSFLCQTNLVKYAWVCIHMQKTACTTTAETWLLLHGKCY